MRPTIRLAAGAAAMLSLAQPALAQGTKCIAPADLADATTYTMPLMIEAAQSSCADVLAADSFVMAEGTAFAANFAPLRDAAWPGTQRMLASFIEKETGASREQAEKVDPAMGGIIMNLLRSDGQELRPFVDAIATQMVADSIKPESCGDIEAILPLLAPLPPENYGELVSVIVGFVTEDDDKLQLCPDGE